MRAHTRACICTSHPERNWQDDQQPPSRRQNQGSGAGGFGGQGFGSFGAVYDPATGRVIFDRELDEAEVEDGDDDGAADVMKSLSKSFELFPALVRVRGFENAETGRMKLT